MPGAVHRREHVRAVAELAGLERRAPEAAQVQAQRAVLARERVPLRIPHPRVADAGVDQHDRGAAAGELDVEGHAATVPGDTEDMPASSVRPDAARAGSCDELAAAP